MCQGDAVLSILQSSQKSCVVGAAKMLVFRLWILTAESMVCGDGLFPSSVPLACAVEVKHEAEGKNHNLRVAQSWGLVRYSRLLSDIQQLTQPQSGDMWSHSNCRA